MNSPFVRVRHSGGSPMPTLGDVFGRPLAGGAMLPFAFQPGDPVAQGFGDSIAGPFGWMGVPETVFFESAFQTQNEDAPRQPPAAAEELQAMPILKVTEKDLDAENTECTICLEKLAVGDSALRIPCGHVFHEDCVRTWLQSNNQCPMCRYELPTDEASLEPGRRERMANRKPRLTLKVLSDRCIRELKYLARHLGVSINGCIEKQELVNAIVESGKVDIIPCAAENDTLEEQSSSTSSSDAEEVIDAQTTINTGALLAITDGEPIIQSFLGDHRPLAALSKQACTVLTRPLGRNACITEASANDM